MKNDWKTSWSQDGKIGAQSRARENWAIWFGILSIRFFPEEIESD
jgi:hypothetical protein